MSLGRHKRSEPENSSDQPPGSLMVAPTHQPYKAIMTDYPTFEPSPQIQDMDRPTVCVIRFHDQPGAPYHLMYEVTIDPEAKSPSGRLIRLDSARGCEAHGWKPVDSMQVVEVLHTFSDQAEFKAALAQQRGTGEKPWA